jgi:sugar phosphate isomerase/epimerase
VSKVWCSTSVRCGSSRETAFRDIANAGFKEIDLLAIEGWVHANPSELGSVASRQSLLMEAASWGLSVRALNTGVGPLLHDRSEASDAARVKETQALVSLMKEAGIGSAAIQPRSGDPSRPWAEVLTDCVSSVKFQVQAAADAGLAWGLELHVHSPFETLDQAKGLLEYWPEAPLIYDPSHFILQGIPLTETGWLMKNAVHVHLRDCAQGSLQTPFGAGEVDFEWVIKSLSDIGYMGGYSLEYLETEGFDALESALLLRDHLHTLGVQ